MDRHIARTIVRNSAGDARVIRSIFSGYHPQELRESGGWMTARKNIMADYLGEESARKVQYFPEGSLLNTMTISIIDSEKRYTDILKEPYTVYLIETKWVRVTSNFVIVPIY